MAGVLLSPPWASGSCQLKARRRRGKRRRHGCAHGQAHLVTVPEHHITAQGGHRRHGQRALPKDCCRDEADHVVILLARRSRLGRPRGVAPQCKRISCIIIVVVVVVVIIVLFVAKTSGFAVLHGCFGSC
jgi:hypothetical protein